MRPWLIVLLLILACAGPAEYQRGTTTRPPPAPAARPGVGAPVVGQPGSAAVPLPRSPGRVLPPSKEPGLWGTEAPRASHEYVLPPVLGFEPPPVAQEEAIVARYADSCAVRVDSTQRFPSVSRALAHASEREVACVGARAYFGCLTRLWAEVSVKKDRASMVLTEALTKYLERLRKEGVEACAETKQTPALKALQSTVDTAYQNSRSR